MSCDAAGRFPEGGLLDRLDKTVSRPLFHCVLPAPLEILLTIPGSWFGCPPYAIGLVPVLVAATSHQTSHFMSLAGGVAAMGSGMWFKLCYDSCMEGSGLLKAYRALDRKFILALPSAVMALVSLGSRDGVAAAALYTASWHVTQLLAEVLKGLSWRLRPAHALESELEKVPRTVTELAAIVKQPSQANLSFPSGDAAGGAVFCSTLMLTTSAFRGPTCLLLLSGVGRIYFHAHHVLDVLAGQALGFGLTYAISRHGHLGWGHVLLSQVFLAGLWMPVQKLKPKGGTKQDLEIRKPDHDDDKS